MLNELKMYLENNSIIFSDIATLNVLCKKVTKEQYQLVIIDGLGLNRKKIKSLFCSYIPLYRKYKIKKQWKKFTKLIEKVKSSR